MAKDKSGARQRSGKEDKASKSVANKKGGSGKKAAPSSRPRRAHSLAFMSSLPLAVVAFIMFWSWRNSASLSRPKPPSLPSVPTDLAPPPKEDLEASPTYLKFGWPQSVVVGGKNGWQGRQSHGIAKMESRGVESSVYMVHNLLQQAEVDALLASSQAAVSSKGGVSQTFFIVKGKAAGPDSFTVQKALQERLTPYVRQQFNCPGCVICSGYVEERPSGQTHVTNYHSDDHMFATLIAPLNPASYTGGLYAQIAGRRGAREFIAFQSGDVAAHRHHLTKGLHVLTGTMHSAVFWFTDGAQACQTETKPWFEHEAAQGDSNAQFEWGNHLIDKGDTNNGLKWLRKAAEKQHFDAIATLGALAMEGHAIKENLTEGFEMTQHAASYGHAVAQFNLGTIHFMGKGLPKNETLAAHWTWQSASQGHPRAAFQMGLVHKFGVGTPINLPMAARWFEIAAEIGVLEAMTESALNYKNGVGVAADPEKSMAWLRKAADNGSAQAKGKLGVEHLQGEITHLNNTLAAQLLEEAANEGDAASQLLIGELYAIGLGVRASRERARAWMKKAAANGRESEVQEVLQGIEHDSNIPWTGLLEEDDGTDADPDEDDLEDIADILGEDDDDLLGSDDDVLGGDE